MTDPSTAVSAPVTGPAAPIPYRGHLPALDGLRGLAILMVFVFHVVKFTPVQAWQWPVAFAATYGWAGVDLFFVLSGFLITGILYDAKGRAGYFRTFYVRRSLRIFPLYYAACAVLFLLLPLLGLYGPAASARLEGEPWYWTYTMNVFVTLRGDMHAAAMSTIHFWSLCVEEQFYLLWPVCVYLLSRKALVRVALGVVVLALAWRVYAVAALDSTLASYVLLPARADGLAVGATLALVARGPGGLEAVLKRVWVAGGAGAVVLLGIVVGLRYTGWDSAWMLTAGFSANALVFGALLAACLRAGAASWLGRLFRSAWLRFFGKYSYGMYLLSGLSGVIVGEAGVRGLVHRWAGAATLTAALVAGAVELAVLTLLAVVSYHAFEQQFLKLKDRFTYRPAPAAAASQPVLEAT